MEKKPPFLNADNIMSTPTMMSSKRSASPAGYSIVATVDLAELHLASLPLTRLELLKVVRHYVDFAKSQLRPGQVFTPGKYIRVLHDVKEEHGAAPVLRYLIARALHKRDLDRKARAYRARKHEENQRVWFFEGGQRLHYLKKYGVYGADHEFLNEALKTAYKCQIDFNPEPESWEEEPEEVTPVTQRVAPPCKGCRTRACSGDFCDWLSRPLEKDLIKSQEWELVRSPALLSRIRYLRASMRADRLSLAMLNERDGWVHPIARSVQPKWTVGEPQSDGLTGEELPTIKSSNVVLTEANPTPASIAGLPSFRSDWHKLCSTETTTDYSYLTDRWTFFKAATWKVSDLEGSEILDFKLDLPCDFVNSNTNTGTMPMFVPFKIHKYFKSDIEIKIHINSNKFQVGQLQFSWHYLEKYDGNPLDNMYSRSQLPHVLINAGTSNEGTLLIPYKYMQPYMFTTKRKNNLEPMYLGTLRCFIVAPLAVGTDGPSDCSISMFIRFPNCSFTGMRDGTIADPQMMEAAAAMVAVKAVDSLIGDRNGDNPSQNSNPSYLVPTATHSWCAGTGLREHLHGLRLDNTTIGVGRSGIDNSETSIGVPCRVFGMLRHFKWSTTDAAKNVSGYQLWDCDVHPQLDKDKFYSTRRAEQMQTYALPPVSVISSLFRQWRGSLEFRFDIIATQFHTGRLLCAYIPGFYGDSSKITLMQARNSPHIEFSLQDSTSFTFVVPYIANQVFWPRKYTGPHKYNENSAPSKLVLFILNPLIPMQSVVNEVKIIPYVRAGPDFEVSVPVQPSLGLSDNPTSYIKGLDKIYPTPGSYPYRATNYEGFGDDKYYILYEGTAIAGTASTFHAPEKTLAENEYYYGKAVDSAYQGTMVYWDAKSVKQRAKIGYIVLWSTEKGNYGVPFPDNSYGETKANATALALKQGKPVAEVLGTCFGYIEDGDICSSSFSKLFFIPQFKTIPKVTSALPQMEDKINAPNALMPTSNLPSTSGGAFNFNESFVDLKDLMRRYQLYSEGTISLGKTFKTGSVVALFPVIPHGLTLNTTSDNIFNSCRDGHIPLCESGYIFFRGSIRFKIVFSSDDVSFVGCKAWVQHHPDGDCVAHNVQKYPYISGEDNYKSHSYAFYLQALNVNSIIEFEVPFYQPGMYGLTRKMADSCNSTDVCQYFTLGNILVGLNTGAVKNLMDFNYSIYYSISDDFSLSCFRGFPMMVFSDEVWPNTLEAKRKRSKVPVVQITPPADFEYIAEPQMEEAQPQMMSAIYNKFVKDPIVNATSDIAKDVMSNVAASVTSEIMSIPKALHAKASEFGIDRSLIISALGQFAQVLHNPTPTSVGIALATVIAQLLGGKFDKISELAKLFTEMTSKFGLPHTPAVARALRDQDFLANSRHVFASFQGLPESEFDVPVNDTCFKIGISICGLLFGSVCSLYGATIAPPKSYPNLLQGINGSLMLSNNIIRLLTNSADFIKYSIQWVTAKIYPDKLMYLKLYDSIPEVKSWFTEAQFLLDVRVKDRFLYDKSMLSRVFDAATMGSILVMNGLDHSSPAGKVIFDTYKDLRKLQCTLFERGAHPDVRFETFPIWMSGRPGIGKSYMVTKMSNDLLKSVKFSQPGSLIYYIPSGAKYWSGCQNPAVLVSDDMFQVGGTKFEDEIANMFMICSSSVLNPPMAAVEDKERRLNPLLYIMLCNSHFPELKPTCKHPEAVYRRRKFLIQADLTEEMLAMFPNFVDASQIPERYTENMGHLRFRLALNVKDPETEYSDWMSYQELYDKISVRFQKHYRDERENFKQRMIDMYCLDPNFNEENLVVSLPGIENKISLKDQIAHYKETIAARLDAYEDPNRCETASTWIRRFMDKVDSLKNKIMPQMGPSFMPHDVYNDTDTAKAFEENLLNLMPTSYMNDLDGEYESPFKQNHPTFYEACEKTYKCLVSKQSNIFSHPLFKLKVVVNAKDISLSETFPWYLPILNSDDTETLQSAFETIIRGIFIDRDSVVDHDWAVKAFHELFAEGMFDAFDMCKFIGCLPGGGKSLAWMLITQSDPECISGIKIPQCYSIAYKRSNILNRKITAKDGFRAALAKLNFAKHTAEYKEYMHASICLLVEKYFDEEEIKHPMMKNFDSVMQVILKSAFFFNYNDFTSILHTVDDYFDNSRKINSDDETLLMIRKKLVKFVMELFATFVVGKTIFDFDHQCDSSQKYTVISTHLEETTFCAYRHRLSYRFTAVKACPWDTCPYSSRLFYSIFALGAVSCSNLRTYGLFPIEYNDIRKYLRASREKQVDSLLNSILKYAKHFFMHTLPQVVYSIFSFVSDNFVYIIGLLLAISGLTLTFGANNALKENNYLQAQQMAAFGAMSMGAGAAVPYYSERAGVFAPQSNYCKFGMPKFSKSHTLASTSNVHFHAGSASVQMGPAQKENIAKKIENNTVMMYVYWTDKDGQMCVRSCRNLMVRGNTMLVLRHYLEEYKHLRDAGFDMTIKLFFNKSNMVSNQTITFEHLIDNVQWCSNNPHTITSNFGLVTLPKFIPNFKDITKYFASFSETQNPSALADLYVVNGESSFGLRLGLINSFKVAETPTSSAVVCERAYTYNKQYKGLCGSVLVNPSGSCGNGSIIGIHVAGCGKSGAGYAEPIYKEVFDAYFAEVPVQVAQIPDEEQLLPLSHANVDLNTNVMMYGCVPKEFAHKESGRTKIVPSLLHGTIYKVRTEVNPLRPKDKRQPEGSDPLRDGCAKHGSGDVIVYSAKLVETVRKSLTDRFQQIVQPIRLQVTPLTMQQAVCGDPSIPYFEAINWKSSEGFPLSSHRPSGAHDKKWLFNLTDTQQGYRLDGLAPLLQQQMALRDICFEQNLKPTTIYIDCLKDYRLTPEKCAQPGKTRIFSIAPIQCSLDCRININDFCASVKNTRIINSIGIGINPDSLEWTQLVCYLNEVVPPDGDGKNFITLDYSNYGPCLMSQLVESANRVIVDWFNYNGADPSHVKRVEWILDNDILNPLHLCDNVVYQTLNGIASGSPLTGEVNSIPNLFYIRLTYLEIMLEHMPEYATMYYFDHFVRIVVYGDDLIMTVCSSIRDLFNGISIQKYLAKHGIKVTPATKTAEMVPYTSIYEASFLKRSFKEHPFRKGVWLGPIEKASIEECVNWCHASDDPKSSTLTNCEASLNLAYSQGPEYYEEHYNKLKRALNSLGLVLSVPNWYERDQQIFGDAEKGVPTDEPDTIKVELPWYYSLHRQTIQQ